MGRPAPVARMTYAQYLAAARPFAALACLALAAAPAVAQRSTTARETPPDTLQQMLDRGEKVLVIDVRTDEEVKTGSIPGAIHIPFEQLEARMKDVPRDVQLVFT